MTFVKKRPIHQDGGEYKRWYEVCLYWLERVDDFRIDVIGRMPSFAALAMIMIMARSTGI